MLGSILRSQACYVIAATKALAVQVPMAEQRPFNTEPEDLTISDWLLALRGGDDSAATQLWKRLEPRLRSLAQKRLEGAPKAVYDEEDLANSALNALCQGARDGRFERLESREDLWKLLSTILSRKASNRRRYHQARPEQGESVLESASIHPGGIALGTLSNEDWVDSLTRDCEDLLSGLDPKLRRVALLKFEGCTDAEIAKRIERAPRTVQRYMELIRAQWAVDLEADDQ